uniref:MFS domain-containing protein n=1 Tax=Trichuris muris TaxID=70415 RepID=A0A5S6QSX3_TRIMR
MKVATFRNFNRCTSGAHPAMRKDGQAKRKRQRSGRKENAGASVGVHGIPLWRSTRLVVILITFLGMLVFTLMRGLIGFAMICMVNTTALALLDPSADEVRQARFNRSNELECPMSSADWQRDYDGQFVWSIPHQSFIFAAASWGELFADLPAGYLVHRYGPKLLLGIGGVIGATATLLTPWASTFGYTAVAATRFFVGVSFAALWPSKSVIVSAWTVKEERSTALSLVTAGNQLSTVLIMPLSAALCKQKAIFGGWPAIFYLTAIAVILWLLLWLSYVKNSPQQHRQISAQEKSFLQGNTVTVEHQSINKPTLKLLARPAVLVVILCQGAATWGMFSLLLYLPQYLRDVMMVDMQKNGLYSAAPFLSQLLFRILFGIVADALYKKCRIHRTTIVKLFNTTGFFSLGSLMFASTFINCKLSTLAVFTISLGTGLWSTVVAGYVTSMILVLPKCAGIISSCSKFFGTSLGVILPYIVGVVIRDGSQSEWQLLFGLSLGILFLSGFAFLIWGSGEEIISKKNTNTLSKNANSDNPSNV